MPTIYVVTSGEYSDYSINAMFSTKELADQYIAKSIAHADLNYNYGYNVEEWELDKYAAAKELSIWGMGMLLDDGSIVEGPFVFTDLGLEFTSRINQIGDNVPCYQNRPIVRVHSTVSAEHARKVAAEARQGWLREQALLKPKE